MRKAKSFIQHENQFTHPPQSQSLQQQPKKPVKVFGYKKRYKNKRNSRVYTSFDVDRFMKEKNPIKSMGQNPNMLAESIPENKRKLVKSNSVN